MAKKIIIANWKMNPSSLNEAKKLFGEVKKRAGRLKKVNTIICPPFVYLDSLGNLVSKGKPSFQVGAQDVFYDNPPAGGGVYTGEISASMLKSLGVKYVILGHSKRRELGETDEIINKKVKTALKNGLKVVLCIGETKRDKEGEYINFVKKQIKSCLKGVPKNLFKNLIITYEPVWAISTNKGGHVDSPESALEMSVFIKKILLPITGNKLARSIPILYGGSVNPKNVEGFLKDAGMQGALVGGASLRAKDFGEILEIANKL